MDRSIMQAQLAGFFRRNRAFADAELDAATICLEQWDIARAQLSRTDFAVPVRYARDVGRDDLQDYLDVAEACITLPIGRFIAVALVAHNLTDAEVDEELLPLRTERMTWMQRVLATFWARLA